MHIIPQGYNRPNIIIYRQMTYRINQTIRTKLYTKVLSPILLLNLFLLLQALSTLSAQVTIGSNVAPNESALLDLKNKADETSNKGLLMPRVHLQSTDESTPLSAHVKGMTVYNLAPKGDVVEGFYYNNGSKWVRLIPETDVFFYMPSIMLPLSESDPSFSSGFFKIQLHQKYEEQFTTSTKSPAATTLPIYDSNRLEFFVLYYDNNVFEQVTIDDGGVLSYRIKPDYEVSEKTFMNIAFKVK